MTSIDLIAEERERQISKEGWTPEHEDQHQGKELIDAAVMYAKYGSSPSFQSVPPMGWPWTYASWKPSVDQIRNLVKSGALIAAEIDRLQRLASKP